jgi:uncharacterized membrane protein YwzB
MVKLDEQWAESITVLFIVLGFIIALLLRNSFLSYISIALAGSLAGRVFYIKRYKEPVLPFVLIIIGFLLGYLVGGFWVSRFWALIWFILAFIVSYQLHVKKIFVIFKSEKFVK